MFRITRKVTTDLAEHSKSKRLNRRDKIKRVLAFEIKCMKLFYLRVAFAEKKSIEIEFILDGIHLSINCQLERKDNTCQLELTF